MEEALGNIKEVISLYLKTSPLKSNICEEGKEVIDI